jgi:hypothetical protein
LLSDFRRSFVSLLGMAWSKVLLFLAKAFDMLVAKM